MKNLIGAIKLYVKVKTVLSQNIQKVIRDFMQTIIS